MLNNLLYISTGIILFCYICYLFLIYFNNKNVSDNNCLDVVTDLLEEYNGINVILSKGIFSYYDIQKRIIKLTEKCYYGNTVSDLSIALIEVGYFINDKKGNKLINLCRKIMPTLKIFYILPIVAVIISNSIYNSTDSIFGIVLILFLIFISFLMMDMKKQTIRLISNNMNIKNIDNINYFIKITILLEWLIIFSEFIMILRFIFL